MHSSKGRLSIRYGIGPPNRMSSNVRGPLGYDSPNGSPLGNTNQSFHVRETPKTATTGNHRNVSNDPSNLVDKHVRANSTHAISAVRSFWLSSLSGTDSPASAGTRAHWAAPFRPRHHLTDYRCSFNHFPIHIRQRPTALNKRRPCAQLPRQPSIQGNDVRECAYGSQGTHGAVVVGVHTPEYGFEKDTANVQAAVKHLNIAYPVAQDNRYATWKSFDNIDWPATYLID